MQRILVALLLVSLTVPAHAAKKRPAGKTLTEEQKALYAIGLVFARQLEVFDLSPADLKMVLMGLDDASKGRKPKVDFALYSKKSQELAIARRDAHGRKLAPKVAEFMAREAAREGAVKTESGLIYRHISEGEGNSPTPSDKVKIDYRSTLIDGKELASTYKTGEPDEMILSEFMKCMTEGVQKMKPGGKARFICPPELALGKEGGGFVPPDATLVFDVELLEVTQ